MTIINPYRFAVANYAAQYFDGTALTDDSLAVFDSVRGRQNHLALSCPGNATHYARMPAANGSLTAPFSVAFWVKAPPGQSASWCYSQGFTTSEGQAFGIRGSSGANTSGRLYVVDANGDIVIGSLTFSAPLFDNSWHNCVITFNGTDTFKAYVDGVYIRDFTITPGLPFTPSRTTLGALGRNTLSGFFECEIADVRHYNYELDAALCTPEQWPIPDLNHWWIDEASGTSFADSVGTDDGTLTGAAMGWGPSRFPGTNAVTQSNCIALDGTGRTLIAQDPAFQLAPGDTFEWNVWVNCATNTDIRGIAAMQEYNVGHALAVVDTLGLRGYFNNSAVTLNTGNNALEQNRWHYVQLIHDGADGIIKVDGEIRAQQTFALTVTTDHYLQVGRVHPAFYFTGSLGPFEFVKNGTTVCSLGLAEGSGSATYDSSGNGFHGTIDGGITRTTSTDIPAVNLGNGFTDSAGVLIPADPTNPGFDVLGGVLTNPAGNWSNGSESQINFGPMGGVLWSHGDAVGAGWEKRVVSAVQEDRIRKLLA